MFGRRSFGFRCAFLVVVLDGMLVRIRSGAHDSLVQPQAATGQLLLGDKGALLSIDRASARHLRWRLELFSSTRNGHMLGRQRIRLPYKFTFC